MTAFGTMAWGERSAGVVSTGEAVRCALQGIAAVLRAQTASWWSGSGLGPAALDEVAVPGGALAKAGEALLAETAAPWLQNHCARTYLWATLLGKRDGLKPDPELLYLASLLHDLGITERFLARPGECFALSGGREARDFLLQRGMAAGRADVVADAIALHLNIALHGSATVEARLLRAGTGLDIVGQGNEALSTALRDAVVARHPRLQCKREVKVAIAAQARQSPATRIGFLCRRLQFLRRVDAAPFAE